ncbi:HEWD family protein [Halovivax cerinus]|uniref:HEWD family protein n=1 Tax=Halovivax cerinus TaxID=1487865 RepID=A0ABD5NSG3_9EURY
MATNGSDRDIHVPNRRRCERCGRTEAWDSPEGAWTLIDSDRAGSRFCIHEWDITGSFCPVPPADRRDGASMVGPRKAVSNESGD